MATHTDHDTPQEYQKMTPETKETFREEISQRLAAVLSLPFPLHDGVVILTDEQREILRRIDKAGDTQLMIATENDERGSIEFLLRHGADVNYRNKKTQQRAIDIAWERGCYECMLVLLQADSDLPDTFSAKVLLETEEVPEELKEFVQETDQMHQWIREGDTGHIQDVISKRTHMRFVNSAGESALETAARYGNVNVLALLLGVPFPIPSGKISLPEYQARLLDVTNASGESPLLLAANEGRDHNVDLLLRSGANINSRDKSGKISIDLAWENHHYKVVLVLLQADSDFPDEFSLDQLASGNGAEELKEFVDRRNEMHKLIRLGSLEEVKNFIKERDMQSRKYLNSQGRSALYTAINENKYDTYAFLKSIGVYFKDKEEEICLEYLKLEEKLELKNAMIRYFPKISDSHILYLVSKSKSSRPYDDFRNKVFNIYKDLDEIPHISKILEVIQYADYFEIVFDFDREDISRMEPRHTTSTRGATDYKSGRLYVGFKVDTPEQEFECLGTLAHELTHLAMQITFKNDCNPYEKYDATEKSRFVNEIVSEAKENSVNFEHANEVIRRVFTDYKDPSDWPAELIVRIPQILAQYGEEEGVEIVSALAPQLLSYFTDNILPKCETFVQQNFLIKPSTMVRTLNQYLGHFSEIEKVDISFKDCSYPTEFFEGSERYILLVSTSNTWLSNIKMYEALQKNRQYSQPYNYIILSLNDFENFKDDILDAFSSEASRLVVVDCHNDMAQNLLPKVLKDLSRVLRLSKHKKAILIVYNNNVTEVKKVINKERMSSKLLEHSDEALSLTDLSPESQNKLLNKKVVFQGTVTALKKLLREETTNFVDSETLVQLINDDIVLGHKLGDLGDTGYYYIDRFFNIDKEISQAVLEDNSILDLFFITGPEKNVFAQYHNVQVCTDENIEIEEQLFSDLCENYVNRNIHHLKLIDGKLIWIKTKGSISSLRSYRQTKNSITLSESDMIRESWGQKLIIISDTAGMGKTTVVTNLALEMKQKYPYHWIFKIDLNNYNHELETELNKSEKSFNEFDLDLALNFLLDKMFKVQTQFEKNVIKDSFKKNGNVILLFDGFDEISPLYEDIILNLIQALKTSAVKRIFVTCRPYVAEVLEEKLGVFSFGIEPFSYEAKKQFLVKFWKKRFSLNSAEYQNENDGSLEVIAKMLIDKLSDSMNDKQQSFTGVPLQLRMVAEIFPENMEIIEGLRMLPASNKDIILPDIPNLLSLYERFIDKKYEIYKAEKMKPATAIAAADIEEAREIFIKNHQKLAVYTLLPNEKYTNTLLSDEDLEYIDTYMDKIFEGKEKTGLIDGVITVMNMRKPRFIHLTFAECFTASFLYFKVTRKINSKEVQKFMLTQIFIEPLYQVVRHFLNWHMENLPVVNTINEYGVTIHDMWSYNPGSICNVHDQTSLHVAAVEDNENIVNFLLLSLEKQNDTLLKLVNAEDTRGRPALHAAAENGNFKIVQWLVERGANVNVKEHDGKTVIFHAAAHNVKFIEYLVEHGADIKLVDMVQLYLHVNTEEKMETFKWLVEKGGQINVGDRYGVTVVHHAAMKGDLETIKWLVDKGVVNPNVDDGSGRTLIHFSAGSAKWEIVKWLVTNGNVDVDLKDENGNSVLQYAAYNGYTDIVQWLVKPKNLGGGGANVNVIDNDGRNVLYDAASSGKLELMKWLVELLDKDRGEVGIDSKDNDGATVLHRAAIFGESDMISWLVKPKEDGGGGAEVNVADKNGQTPLDNAASLGQLEIIQLMMSHFNDDYIVENMCKKIVHKAASFGEVALVEWLLKNARADVNYKDESGRCLLHYAAKHNNSNLVKWLLESGADVNIIDTYGKTALHEAAGTGIQDIEEWLEKRHIYVQSVDGSVKGIKKITIEVKPNQNNFVQYLREKDYPIVSKGFGTFVFDVNALATLKLLLESGADVSSVDKHGRTPLYYATFLDKPGVVGWDIIKFLLTPVEDSGGGADIHIEDDTGRTLIHIAAEDGADHIMKWLFEINEYSKTLVNVADTKGFTPLHYAAKSYSPSVVIRLISNGGDFKAVNNYGRTALHEAAIHDYFDTLRVLVAAMVHRGDHITLNATDKDGLTALHYAALKGNIRSVKYLAQNGADINITDSDGRTPLHLAVTRSKIKVVTFLVERNANDLLDNTGKTALDLTQELGNEYIKQILENAGFLAGDSIHSRAPIENLIELQRQISIVELQPTEDSSTSGCNSQLRKKRDLGRCSFQETDYFPYSPLEGTVSAEDRRYSEMYSNICMLTVFNNVKESSRSDKPISVNAILNYSKYIGDIINRGIVDLSSREKVILADKLTGVREFFKLYPQDELLIESLQGSEFFESKHQSWIFDNGEYTMTVLKREEHYEIFSQDFNYKEMFRTKDYLTFNQLRDFVKSFFKWRSGKTQHRLLTLTSNLQPNVVQEIETEIFRNYDENVHGNVLVGNNHNLIDNIPIFVVQELFLVNGKHPDVELLNPIFFVDNENISVQLEILYRIIPDLSVEQNTRITTVINKYNIPFEFTHTNDLNPGDEKLLDMYKTNLSNKLKVVNTLTTEYLSDISWETMVDELKGLPDISEDFARDVIRTTKEFHKTASTAATIKGMATQTLFFLPDFIRSLNYGDLKNTAKTMAVIGGDTVVNTIYEHFVNRLTSVLPAGRVKLLSKLPVTSPIFKAITIYSIVELHKRLLDIPENSVEYSIIKHKLGEQYLTAGLIVAEMLGFEVTPLWIGLIAEQLIFDADSFRKTHHLDIPFWEAFVMSLGFEQDKLQNIFEERQLVEMNLATANRRNYENRMSYGWTIVKLPKLGNIEWQNIGKDTVPTDIQNTVRNTKEEFSSITLPQKITSVNGFRLINTYKLRRKTIYGNVVITRGKIIGSEWQRAVYNVKNVNTVISLLCLLNNCNSSFEGRNYFLSQGSGNNTNWENILSVQKRLKYIHIATTMATELQQDSKEEIDFDPLYLNCSGLSSLYFNNFDNQTYAERNAQQNVYLAFDPREGDISLNITTPGLHKLHLIANENIKASDYSSHADVSSNMSPYLITIEVGSKTYPDSVRFPNKSGKFSLRDSSKKIISQYVITDEMDYVIEDMALATSISFPPITMHAGKNESWNTVNGDFRRIVAKSWKYNRINENDANCTEYFHLEHSAIVMLSADKVYLQLHLGNYAVDEFLELSATHVDILEARGKCANYSKINMSPKVHSFDVDIRSNIVIEDANSMFRVVGELLTGSVPVHYKKSSHNRSMSFYDITVGDLWEIIKTMWINATLDNSKPYLRIKFVCDQVQMHWHNKVPAVNVLSLIGTFEGMMAVLQMQQDYKKITISNATLALELTAHYNQTVLLNNSVILQSLLTTEELDLNMDMLDKFHERLNHAGDLIKLFGSEFSRSNVLVFKAVDGHPVYHVVPADSRIKINKLEYAVENGIMCVQAEKNDEIDGQQLLKFASPTRATAEDIVGICVEKFLTDCNIFVRNQSLIINGVEMKHMEGNTKIYFKNMVKYSARVLIDTFKHDNEFSNENYNRHINNTAMFVGESQETDYPARRENATSEPRNTTWLAKGLSNDESQSIDPQTEDSPSRYKPKHRKSKRFVKFRRASHNFVTSGAARRVLSPLGSFINWLGNSLDWISLSTFSQVGGRFLRDDTVPLNTTNSHPTNFMNFSDFQVNGVLGLLNLAVRKITKAKPHLVKETPLSSLWLQGEVLNIVAKFEYALEKIAKEVNILPGKLEFQPVDLQIRLLHELNQGHYRNIENILYDSLDKTASEDRIRSVLKEKIHELLKDR